MFFFFQAEDGIRDVAVTGVQTCALPISCLSGGRGPEAWHHLQRTKAAVSQQGRWQVLRHLEDGRAGHQHTSPCARRSEEHTSELQSRLHLVCRLLLEKKKKNQYTPTSSAKSRAYVFSLLHSH